MIRRLQLQGLRHSTWPSRPYGAGDGTIQKAGGVGRLYEGNLHSHLRKLQCMQSVARCILRLRATSIAAHTAPCLSQPLAQARGALLVTGSGNESSMTVAIIQNGNATGSVRYAILALGGS
jgi:hypothetical protein